MIMETVNIVGTEDTPGVILDYESGEFVISGRSLPEDVASFYKPILEWLDEFSRNPRDGAKFLFKLEYFNTASSKILLDVFLKLEEISEDTGKSFVIEWHHQTSDPDMLAAGEEYAELVAIPFEYIAY